MLKKTVIAVAIAAAGLMAVSPLAFASGHPSHVKNVATETSGGFVNLADNNVNVPSRRATTTSRSTVARAPCRCP